MRAECRLPHRTRPVHRAGDSKETTDNAHTIQFQFGSHSLQDRPAARAGPCGHIKRARAASDLAICGTAECTRDAHPAMRSPRLGQLFRTLRVMALAFETSRCGRTPVDAELRAIIRRMRRDNRLWGENRIAGELAKLGWRVSPRTVAKYPGGLGRGRGPGWATFLRNHAGQIWACDFLPSSPCTSGRSMRSSSSPSSVARSGTSGSRRIPPVLGWLSAWSRPSARRPLLTTSCMTATASTTRVFGRAS